MKYRKILILFISVIMCSAAFSFNSAADEAVGPIKGEILDFDGIISEWLEEEIDTPTGTEFKLWESYGGFWADAEKDPDPGDNLLCWAATAANMMEWTGWGFVGGMEEGNTDDFFQFFRSHVTDGGHFVDDAIEWWFTGTLADAGSGAATEDVDHTGFYPFSASTLIFDSWDMPNSLKNIYEQLIAGKPVGLSIYSDGGGAHAVTCWGVNYDTDFDRYTDPDDFYLGIWLTDSDSHKNQWNPDDVLRYFEVDYDSGDGRWEMPNYGGGWFIKGVTSLALNPFETRPVADAGISYWVDEGSTVWFDASGSTDDDPLMYRWDFDDDGVWDTGWLTSTSATHTWDDDYSGTVRLEVFDGILRDMDTTIVTIENVAPSITVFATDCDEDSLSTVQVTVSDPGVVDTFTADIDWGDGTIETSLAYTQMTVPIIRTHQYLDDDPSGTSSDDYTVTVTVVDDDGGSVTEEYNMLTVANLDPVIYTNPIVQPNEQFILPGVHELDFGASYTDTGTLDTHTIEWNMGDGTIITGTLTPSHTYMAPGDYTVTLIVTDDDTGADSETWEVEVADAQEALEDLDQYLQDLPDYNYKDKTNIRKNAFDKKFKAIYKQLENEAYQKIIDKLNLDLRIKCDGTVDGDPIDDWIIDPIAQVHICQKIDDITAYLQTF